ncbi:MAG TPA: hypothetical protein VIH82_02905 [Acidimicrobiia bacterium]
MFARTREAWHAVAEHVLAAARYAAEGRIGLAAAPGGFGIPPESACTPTRVAGQDLLVRDGAAERSERLTTVAAAAAALGIEPGSPPVYARATALEPHARLDIDLHAARAIASWFELVWSVLIGFGGTVTLWPEHFDVATTIGDESRGRRGTYGASPGDADHPEPYLYVTHWADVPDDAYWNDDAFGGASLGYEGVADAADPVEAATAFFGAGRALIMQGRAGS